MQLNEGSENDGCQLYFDLQKIIRKMSLFQFLFKFKLYKVKMSITLTCLKNRKLESLNLNMISFVIYSKIKY